MTHENLLHSKIRNYIEDAFGGNFVMSMVTIETFEKPSRFKEPVFLAAVSLKPLEKDVVVALSEADPADFEKLREHLAEGNEAACIFNSSGEEIEMLFRGMDYFFDYQKIEI